MACSVFGSPVTDETLKEMNKYAKKSNITRLDRAEVAFELKNEEGKDVNAHQYLDEIRKNNPSDGIKALFYNATGGAVRVVTYISGDGSVGASPVPSVIANGQWGAYLHARDPKPPATNTAAHAIVFAGKNADGIEQQWMFVAEYDWPGRCLTEIRPAGYYPMSDNNYKNYKVNLQRGSYVHRAEAQGCESFASIGGDATSPFFVGILTLTGAYGW